MAYVVSGCPRSGTSLMMDLLRVTFGQERILGYKFPFDEKRNRLKEKTEDEDENEYNIRRYVQKKISENNEDEVKKRIEYMKQMNPHGFWEMEYSVSGIQYNLFDYKNIEKLLTENTPSILKIVSQGLLYTDPVFVDKMIYMVRHPRQVAKSQESLVRNDFLFTEGNEAEVNGEIVKAHTPKMYLEVTAVASQWIQSYPEVPVIFVNFDDLISNPAQELKRIQEFLGEGDFTKAKERVKPKLKRSEPNDLGNPLWEDAENVYSLFGQGDFNGVLEYLSNKNTNYYKYSQEVMCCRDGEVKTYLHCRSCRNSKATRGNFKMIATNKGIDWQNEPCTFECRGLGEGRSLTIQESIENNFWVEGVVPLTIID